MLTGIIIAAFAGFKRDRIHSRDTVEVEGIKKGKNVRLGILLAFLCGLFGSLMNIGFARGVPIAQSAESFGASTGNSSLAVWVVLFMGAFISNAGYAVIMMTRNRTWNTFLNTGLSKGIMWATITAIASFAGAGIYGQGAVLMGGLGPVIGWPIHLSVVIIFSNFWGLRTGEWKGAMRAFNLIIISVVIFLIANFILGYARSLY
jgi:L-rhamnose-H+ transport protein